MNRPDAESLRTLGAALRKWYYVVGIEMEVIVEADYPSSGHDALHAMVHRVLDPLDRHRHPRVVANLVGNLADWNINDWPAQVSAVGRLKPAPRPVLERTVAVGFKERKLTKR